MSKRMNLTPIIVANCRVISVLPTPVGPEKRNEPIGFSSSDKPDRDIFIDELKALIALSWPNTTKIWPNGGSSIYPWISRGIIDAYLMINEPRSEIDPGLSFAYFSGYPVYELNTNNQLAPYEFNPKRTCERTKILLASCTTELANEIINECNIN